MPNKAPAEAEKTRPNSLNFESKDIPLKDLLLDPNNYRFLDNKGYKPKPKNRYASETIQAATLRLLSQDKRYQLGELKKSILTNGYVPMERIIVVPYEAKAGKYLIVEGNRRIAALKSLIQDSEEEVHVLSEEELQSYSAIPCAILKVAVEDRPKAERIIMGIRHITGPREWGAYQQAQLILELHDEENQDFAAIGEHLGISTVEVARRYRAMSALQAMEQDELYADKATPEHYRLLHEMVSLPEVRKRFGWDSETNQFSDQEKAREFFELIAPQTKETTEAKLKTFSDVRKLKQIIGHPSAEETLLDPNKSYLDALAEVTQFRPQIKKSTFSEFLSETLDRLKETTRQELKDLKTTDKTLIKNLIKELQEILK